MDTLTDVFFRVGSLAGLAIVFLITVPTTFLVLIFRDNILKYLMHRGILPPSIFWRIRGKVSKEWIEDTSTDEYAGNDELIQAILATHPGTVLEIGCGNGKNLRQIRKLSPDIEVYGTEVSREYAREGRKNGIDVIIKDITAGVLYPKDVVFSCATLMYVHPDKLRQALQNMFAIAQQYVMLCEKQGQGEYDGGWSHDYRSLIDDLDSSRIELVDAKAVENGRTLFILKKI